MGSLWSPVLRFYQLALYPVAKPCAAVLDMWLGKEGIDHLREKELISLIRAHMESEQAEVSEVEGRGALNFLTIDEINVIE